MHAKIALYSSSLRDRFTTDKKECEMACFNAILGDVLLLTYLLVCSVCGPSKKNEHRKVLMCILLLLLLSESRDRANQNISLMLYMTHLKCPCGDFEWICLKPLHLCSNFSTWSSSPCLVRHSVHFCREQRRRRPVKNFLLPKFTTTQIIAPMAIFRMPSGFAFFSIFFLVSFADALCSPLCVPAYLDCLVKYFFIMKCYRVLHAVFNFLCPLSLPLSHHSSLSLNYIAAHSSERERFNNFLFIYVFRENKFADVDAETFYGHQKKRGRRERERKN